jgi:hypothetical protein
MKVLGEAPAMPMGSLFWSWAKYGNDVRTQEFEQELFTSLMDLPRETSTEGSGGEGMYAAPVWSDGHERAGKASETGRDGGHHGQRGAGDDAGLTTALALFKGFGHGDLDL